MIRVRDLLKSTVLILVKLLKTIENELKRFPIINHSFSHNEFWPKRSVIRHHRAVRKDVRIKEAQFYTNVAQNFATAIFY